jgi:hypothetical protein
MTRLELLSVRNALLRLRRKMARLLDSRRRLVAALQRRGHLPKPPPAKAPYRSGPVYKSMGDRPGPTRFRGEVLVRGQWVPCCIDCDETSCEVQLDEAAKEFGMTGLPKRVRKCECRGTCRDCKGEG